MGVSLSVAVECVLGDTLMRRPLAGFGFWPLRVWPRRGRGLTDAPAAPQGAGVRRHGLYQPRWWLARVPMGAVVLIGPQLAGSGQSRRFNAAFVSRSTTSPGLWADQVFCRYGLYSPGGTVRRRVGCRPWWIWLDGNQRSANVNRPPWRAVLYTSMGFNRTHGWRRTRPGGTPAGPMPRVIAATSRSSITMWPYTPASSVVSWWGGFAPQVHTPAIEADQLGFRCRPSSGAGYAAGKVHGRPADAS